MSHQVARNDASVSHWPVWTYLFHQVSNEWQVGPATYPAHGCPRRVDT
jgi:hypothetical protein